MKRMTGSGLVVNRVASALLSGLLWAPVLSAAPAPAPQYVFTDATAQIAAPGAGGAVPCHVATITVEGFGPKATMVLQAVGGAVKVRPLCEGIHVVSLGAPVNAEARFLAIVPPPALDAVAVRQRLPRKADKLMGGKPFTILAMGDSVTQTGDYESMLVMMLARATGNPNVTFVDKSYGGRSVDAAVRHFARDTKGIEPDLGLLMYGLNDQGGFVPPRAYLEQYAWIAEALDAGFGADTVFLQPTPHIAVFAADKNGSVEPPATALRTIGYAEALTRLGARLGVSVASTFAALWGRGAGTVLESAMGMWPLYPSAGPCSTLLETRGVGDTIHPNALGHLQIARAVFAALAGAPRGRPLRIEGVSRWTPRGVVSRITAANQSGEPREGRLEAYPPTAAQLDTPDPASYRLKPGESASFEVRWPAVVKPEDLLRFPYTFYLNQDFSPLPVVDFSDGGGEVYCVGVPFETPGGFQAERFAVQGRHVDVTLRTPDGTRKVAVDIPKGSQVGRIPLIRRLQAAGKTGYAAAEAVYAEYGHAPIGEAAIDGDLREWQGHRWAPVGERCQARGRAGPADHRQSLEEAYLQVAFKAGKAGVFLALRGRGSLAGDNAILFFDTRKPDQLGTVGPYYWANLGIKPEGAIGLGLGETSTAAPGMAGRWKPDDGGLTAEAFIPYALMDMDAWPESGDLGFSLIWNHLHADGETTRLTWSENGHEWNPRWYGVVRRQEGPDGTPSFMVRVE